MYQRGQPVRWANSLMTRADEARRGSERAPRLKERRASPGGEARWRDSEGGIVGGNVGGRIDFNGAVQLGNPNSADFPRDEFHRGAVLLALAVD